MDSLEAAANAVVANPRLNPMAIMDVVRNAEIERTQTRMAPLPPHPIGETLLPADYVGFLELTRAAQKVVLFVAIKPNVGRVDDVRVPNRPGARAAMAGPAAGCLGGLLPEVRRRRAREALRRPVHRAGQRSRDRR